MFESKIVNDDETLIEMKDMKPCQIGSIVDSKKIVMRTANKDEIEVMDLTDVGADSCWVGEQTIPVRLLPKGTKIILEVK